MTKQEILGALSKLNKDRQWLAEATGYKYDYVKNSLAKNAPEPSEKFSAQIQRAFAEEERRQSVDMDRPDVSVWDLVYFSGKELSNIDRAKKAGGYEELPKFYRDAVIAFADRLLAEESNIVPMTTRKAHINAAAGSPIAAEVLEWEGEDETVRVKINGLSMIPLLNDGDIVEMKHKRASRSPYMKKGLIYLVEYDGGYTVKKYNTRKALPEEIGQEWAEMGKVKILQSLNPDFPEIIIKQEVEWFAWLPEKKTK